MTNDYRQRAAEAAQALAGDPRLEDVALVIEQRITDAESIVAHYHLRLGAGVVAVIDGPAENPDVVITQDRATADSIRAGEAHAHRAFLTGRLRIDGDVDALLEHGELLSDLAGGPAPSNA